jgi:hypothetical protein
VTSLNEGCGWTLDSAPFCFSWNLQYFVVLKGIWKLRFPPWTCKNWSPKNTWFTNEICYRFRQFAGVTSGNKSSIPNYIYEISLIWLASEILRWNPHNLWLLFFRSELIRRNCTKFRIFSFGKTYIKTESYEIKWFLCWKFNWICYLK